MEYSDDAAHMNMGSLWRMPSHEQIVELINECNWEWTELNGVPGYKVTSRNSTASGRWIFLPAAGWYMGSELQNPGADLFYWSRSLYPEIQCDAYDLEHSVMHGALRYYFMERFFGYPVRAVRLYY